MKLRYIILLFILLSPIAFYIGQRAATIVNNFEEETKVAEPNEPEEDKELKLLALEKLREALLHLIAQGYELDPEAAAHGLLQFKEPNPYEIDLSHEIQDEPYHPTNEPENNQYLFRAEIDPNYDNVNLIPDFNELKPQFFKYYSNIPESKWQDIQEWGNIAHVTICILEKRVTDLERRLNHAPNFIPSWPEYIELDKDLVILSPKFNLDNESYGQWIHTIDKGTKIYFRQDE